MALLVDFQPFHRVFDSGGIEAAAAAGIPLGKPQLDDLLQILLRQPDRGLHPHWPASHQPNPSRAIGFSRTWSHL
jgi:hypothetical protein